MGIETRSIKIRFQDPVHRLCIFTSLEAARKVRDIQNTSRYAVQLGWILSKSEVEKSRIRILSILIIEDRGVENPNPIQDLVEKNTALATKKELAWLHAYQTLC